MIKLSMFDFFLRAIPESFAIVLLTILLSKKSISKKKYFTTSILYSIVVYLVRMLPIHLGIHTIIITLIYILVSILLNKIPVYKSIFSTLVTIILLEICELANLYMLISLKINVEMILNDPFKKLLYFSPSLFLFVVLILVIYLINYKGVKEAHKQIYLQNIYK